MFKKICVFLGASPGRDPDYALGAQELGTALAKGGFELVYGASDIGLMGILAKAALDAGGRVLGIIPDALHQKVNHPPLTDLRVVRTMHERKALMHEKSDAFLLYPGGIGSMEEFFETFTWLQLGFHNKPVGVMNIKGFYNPLKALLIHLADEGFTSHSAIERIHFFSTVPEALSFLHGLEASPNPKG